MVVLDMLLVLLGGSLRTRSIHKVGTKMMKDREVWKQQRTLDGLTICTEDKQTLFCKRDFIVYHLLHQEIEHAVVEQHAQQSTSYKSVIFCISRKMGEEDEWVKPLKWHWAMLKQSLEQSIESVWYGKQLSDVSGMHHIPYDQYPPSSYHHLVSSLSSPLMSSSLKIPLNPDITLKILQNRVLQAWTPMQSLRKPRQRLWNCCHHHWCEAYVTGHNPQFSWPQTSSLTQSQLERNQQTHPCMASRPSLW